jgi:hypothetical protein
MAELSVQPKRRAVWPWILLALLIIGALVYFLVYRNNNTNDVTNVTPTTTQDTARTNTTTQ